MLNFHNLNMAFDPYPFGVIRPVVQEDLYSSLVETFPQIDQLVKNKVSEKFSLSRGNNGSVFQKILDRNKCWRDFAKYVESRRFIGEVFEALKSSDVDLGIEASTGVSVFDLLEPNKFRSRKKSYFSKFEFSALPSNDGGVLPHTDAKDKIVTLVIPLVTPNYWNHDWGGQTNILSPITDEWKFNLINKTARHEDMTIVDQIPFCPNQALIFIKTYNSWHSVSPLCGPKDPLKYRRSITINIVEKY